MTKVVKPEDLISALLWAHRNLHVDCIGGKVDHDGEHRHRREGDTPREQEEEDQGAEEETHGHGHYYVELPGRQHKCAMFICTRQIHTNNGT